MPKHSINNQGSSPIIFITGIGCLVIIAISVGFYFISGMTVNQKTLKQVNAFIDKNNEVLKLTDELNNIDDDLSNINKILGIYDDIDKKWSELRNIDLPENIKSEYKECFERYGNDIKNRKEIFQIYSNAYGRNSQLNASEEQKISKLNKEFNNEETLEICKVAYERMVEILNKQGITISKK